MISKTKLVSVNRMESQPKVARIGVVIVRLDVAAAAVSVLELPLEIR